ncbi:hypothetical protein AOLI_G00090180 [Acnodon oligacanthus]
MGEEAEDVPTLLRLTTEESKHCGYGTLHNEMIRDRLVLGLRDKKLSEQLQMDPEMMLERAVNRVRQSELVKKQQDMLKSNFKGDSAGVNIDICSVGAQHKESAKLVKHQGARAKSSLCTSDTKQSSCLQCRRCGKEAHSFQHCPAREATCKLCKKKGTGEISTATDHREDISFLDSISASNAHAPWLVKVKVGKAET